MRFNKAFFLFILKICQILEKSNNMWQYPYSFAYTFMSLWKFIPTHYVKFSCQPMRIKKPYSSSLTRNTCCCHLPKHLCFYGKFHLRDKSFQVVNQSELSNHNHHLPHLTRVVDIHLHIYAFMEIFSHALRHFKSSSNQRTRWYWPIRIEHS